MVIKRTQKTLMGIAIGFVAAVISLVLWSAGLLDRWEYTTWTWRVSLLARPGPATTKIKIILLDQASLDWGKEENHWSWPWPREVYAPLIDFCTRGGAKAIIFDVLYTEPSVYGVRDDEALEAAIRRASSFVAPLALGDESGTVTSWPMDIPDRTLRFAKPEQAPTQTILQQLSVPHCTFPIPEVARSATLLANIIDESDSDSIFRRARLFQVFDHRAVPSLAVAAYLAGRAAYSGGTSDLNTVMEQAHIEDGWLVLGQQRFPVDAQQRAILRFRGPSETHETFSAAAVIQSELRLREGRLPIITNPEVFKDCYVLFGFSAPGLKDLRPTPLSPTYPGVEIHATVLDNLLSNDFLRDAPRWLVILSVLLLAEASAIFVVSSKKVRHSILAFAVFLSIPARCGNGVLRTWLLVAHCRCGKRHGTCSGVGAGPQLRHRGPTEGVL